MHRAHRLMQRPHRLRRNHPSRSSISGCVGRRAARSQGRAPFCVILRAAKNPGSFSDARHFRRSVLTGRATILISRRGKVGAERLSCSSLEAKSRSLRVEKDPGFFAPLRMTQRGAWLRERFAQNDNEEKQRRSLDRALLPNHQVARERIHSRAEREDAPTEPLEQRTSEPK